MSKVRIYEIAKQTGLSNNDVIARLADLGIVAKSHSSSLPKAQADAFVATLHAEEQKREEAKAEAARKEAEQYDLDNLGIPKGVKANRIVPPHMRKAQRAGESAGESADASDRAAKLERARRSRERAQGETEATEVPVAKETQDAPVASVSESEPVAFAPEPAVASETPVAASAPLSAADIARSGVVRSPQEAASTEPPVQDTPVQAAPDPVVSAAPSAVAPSGQRPARANQQRQGRGQRQGGQQAHRDGAPQRTPNSAVGQPGVPRPGTPPRPGQPTVGTPVRRRIENTMPREGSGRRAIPPPVKAAPKDHQAPQANRGQRRGAQQQPVRTRDGGNQSNSAAPQTQQPNAPQNAQPGFRDGGAGKKGRANKRRKADPTPQELFEQENRPRRTRKKSGPVKVTIDSVIEVLPGVTVNELAKQFGVNPTDIIGALFRLGEMVTVTQSMSNDLVELVAAEMDAEIKFVTPEDVEFGDEIIDDESELEDRPPVVTVMGHVDHGKTKLLDAIRHADVVAGEAGGITQHIGAYQITRDGRKITFIDTPGHEAFTAMRARGASVTDVAILVVAADDGVKPQTVEAIEHIQAADVPMIVAVNKIDKPDADPMRVRTQLTEYNLIAEEFGGQTTMVDVSALKQMNLDELLDLILLQADVQEVKSNPNREASGTVIEANLDRGRGAVATVLIQNGTLRVGDNVVAGVASCRVRAMFDDKGDRVESAEPAKPVQVIGWSDVPAAGDVFRVVDNERIARDIASSRKDRERKAELANRPRLTLEGLSTAVQEGQLTSVNLIIKGDVSGTVEAVAAKMDEIDVEGIRTRIVRRGVGAVTNDDVNLAEASDAIIIAFNVRAEAQARKAIEDSGIDLRHYSIIYKAIEDVEAAIKGLLAPETHEVVLGRATIREVFKVPRGGFVFGSYVNEGNLKRHANVRIIRDGVVIATDSISSLRRFKEDVGEVATNFECGIGLTNFQDIKAGDEVEAFEEQEIKRK